MFDSSVLDVAIGLVFVYLLLSLTASSAREGIEALIKQRARGLLRGIKELLGEQAAQAAQGTSASQNTSLLQAASAAAPDLAAEAKPWIDQLYNHGLINALYTGKFDPQSPRKLPSYIPSKNFALAIVSLWSQYRKDGNQTGLTVPQNVQTAFTSFELVVKGDETKFLKLVEDWYNSAMDRVAGRYKRHTQTWLFLIGLFLSIAVNADTIQIAQRLSTDKTLRGAVVQAAQQQTNSDEVKKQVKAELDRRAQQDLQSKSAAPRTRTTHATPPASTVTPSTPANTTTPGTTTPDTTPATGTQPPAPEDATPATPTVEQSIVKIKSNLNSLDGVGLPVGWNAEYSDWKTAQEAAARQAAKDKAAQDKTAQDKLAQDKAPQAPPTTHASSAPAGQPQANTPPTPKPASPAPLPDGIKTYWTFFLQSIPKHFPGWLLTALALSLGAPFWFDLLNKFMVVRSTVKPHEKSAEEKSKDGQSATPTPDPTEATPNQQTTT